MEPNILHGPLVPSVLLSNLSTPLNKFLLDVGQSHLSSVCMIDPETDEQLTVGSVLERSLILATELQALGCKPGCIVGLLCENRIEYPVMMLSVLHTGATLACFNPNYSIGELEHTVTITQPYIMFAETQSLKKLERVKDKCKKLKYVINVDEKQSRSSILGYAALFARKEKLKYVQPSISSDSTALILFSSGSTGLPKGVMLSNMNLVFLLDMVKLGTLMAQEEGAPKIVALSVIPMFHGYGILTVLRTLVCEETIVIMKKFHQEKFLSAIQRYKVTRLTLVPALVVFLVKHPIVEKYDLSSVKEITSGAAPLSVDIEREVHKKFPTMEKLVKGYGMTETTIVCTVSVLSDKDKFGSVGKVAPGMIAKVIDLSTGEPVGANKEGEICFKGIYLMQGYYNNEEETKKTIDEYGWLHTGDVGYYDDDEDIFIVDRIKDLIKYKGYQVPPAELESILLKHEGIKDVAVIGIPDESAGELPRAFVVRSGEITEKEIVEYVAARVAPHMKLRGGVIFVNEIPRNVSGKILRRELRNWSKSKL